MQLSFLGLSVLVNTISALFFIPYIVRGFTGDELALVSIIIMMVNMFGALDFFRPVFISSFSFGDRKVPFLMILHSTIIVGLIALPFFSILFYFFLGLYFDFHGIFFIFLSFLIFVFSSGYWASMDVNGKVGLSLFLKSISTFLLYSGFYVLSVTEYDINFVYVAFFSQVFLCFSFLLFGFSYVDFRNKVESVSDFYWNGFYTLWQNFSKIVIDFSDRIFVAKFLAPDFTAIYNFSYEVSSRVNMPAQLASSYFYPKICSGDFNVSKFLFFGLLFSFMILVFSLFIFVFGEPVFLIYFGDKFSGRLDLFVAMILIFSVFSLSFFVQSAMRAIGKYSFLSVLFFSFALFGLILIYPLYVFFGVKGVLFAVFITKLPGAYGYFYLRDYFFRYKICALVFCYLNPVVFMCFLYFSEI